MKILLVEDNRDALVFLSIVLARFGHEVRTAPGAVIARAMLRHGQFELLVADIALGDGSGYEVMEMAALRNTPGIAMSGHNDDEAVRSSLQAGFAAHLGKPIDVVYLGRLIEEIEATLWPHGREGGSRKDEG